MRWGRRALIGVGITLLLLAATGAGAGGAGRPSTPKVSPVLGADFPISGPEASSGEFAPAVAWNGSGNEYLVVWQDLRHFLARRYDIYGQLVSATGSLVGAEVRISDPQATFWEQTPAVAWNDTDGEYLVVWSDERSVATRGWEIYGQLVSAAGSLVGSNFRISGPGAVSDDYQPAVAWNSVDGEYLVVWEDGRAFQTRGADVFGQRVSAAGSLVGRNFRISGPGATGDDEAPAPAWNPADGEYLVVWTDKRNNMIRGWDIYGRRLSAEGSAIGDEFILSGPGATGQDSSPAVAWNGTDAEYLVVWEDLRNAATRGADIFGQRVSAAGSAEGPNFRISAAGAISDDRQSAVAWNGAADQYLVVWEDGRGASARGVDIFGRRVSAGGSAAGADFRISGAGAVADDHRSAVVWNGTADEYLVVWEDGRSASFDIFGRRVAG